MLVTEICCGVSCSICESGISEWDQSDQDWSQRSVWPVRISDVREHCWCDTGCYL